MKERERLASLGQMAAGLAHEIRNPLGSIKGAAQVLQPIVQETNDASIKEFLNIIVEEVDRLNKIVSQFLDYARPYRGDPKPLDINDAVRKTLALMEKEGGHTGIEISTALFEGLPQVRADAEQLRQVFLNLSINAIQAMPQGGKLAVSSSLRRSTLRGATAAFLEVRFRDTGVGITAGDLKNLFIPFFTTKEKGTGLGLPISQRIVENHGGAHRGAVQAGRGQHLHRAVAHRGRRLRLVRRHPEAAAAHPHGFAGGAAALAGRTGYRHRRGGQADTAARPGRRPGGEEDH